jgi:serine/threonine protein kinase
MIIESNYKQMETKLYDIKDFYLINKISEGGFGRIYGAFNIKNGDNVAVKYCKVANCLSLNREIEVCSRLDNNGIVKLLGYGELSGCKTFAVFEYIKGLCLANMMLNRDISYTNLKSIMFQLLCTICYIHSEGVVHNDIKPDNILITDGIVKLIDFGSSEFIQSKFDCNIHKNRCKQGTPRYIAPDIIQESGVAEYSDIYAWGIILLECLTGIKSNINKSGTTENCLLPHAIRSHPAGEVLKYALFPDRYGYVTSSDLLSMFAKVDVRTIYNRIHRSKYTFYLAAGNTVSY